MADQMLIMCDNIMRRVPVYIIIIIIIILVIIIFIILSLVLMQYIVKQDDSSSNQHNPYSSFVSVYAFFLLTFQTLFRLFDAALNKNIFYNYYHHFKCCFLQAYYNHYNVV